MLRGIMKINKPDDLGPEGSELWDSVVEYKGDRLLALDLPALRMACRWLDRFNDHVRSIDKGADIRLGIASDKFLLLCTRFGLTPADRKGADDNPKPKATGRKKTAVDSMTPEKLGVRPRLAS